MRSTIKVFVKTELKKRETSRAKESKDSAPPTPVESLPNPQATSRNVQDTVPEPAKEDISASSKSAGEPGQSAGVIDDLPAKTQTTEAEDGPENLSNDVCNEPALLFQRSSS